MKKTLIITAIFIGVLLCAVGYADSQYRTSIGRQAPALWLPSQGARAPETTLAAQSGNYVMLNFWKSTDAMSRQAANEYTAWLRSHPGNDLKLLSVNLDESPALFGEIMRRDSLIGSTQYHHDGDAARAVIDSYGLDKGLGSVLIDPDGKIVSHNPSQSDLDNYFGH